MSRRRTLIISAILSAAAWTSAAGPELPWRFIQIIDTGGQHSRRATISADGRIVAFDSRADVTPGAPGSKEENIELFLYDTVAGSVTQVTDTQAADSRRASLSGDGRLVAFESNADLAPGKPGNPDGSFEIFLFDAEKAAFTQLTDARSGACIRAAISLDGARVAFASNADLVTGGNREGNYEIFLFDAGKSAVIQITDATARHSRRPAVNADGSLVAFDADADLVAGPGSHGANSEIFLYRSGGGLTRITEAATGDSEFASISADGRLIAFQSSADLAPGSPGNPDGNLEIFVYHTVTAALTQVTDTRAGDNFAPSVNAGGRRVAFYSDADPALCNPDGNLEIFVYDLVEGALAQITDTTVGAGRRPRMTADGSRLVFDSSADLVSGNRDRNQEIFLAGQQKLPDHE